MGRGIEMNKTNGIFTLTLTLGDIEILKADANNFVGIVNYNKQNGDEKELIYQTLLAMNMPETVANEVNNLSWFNDAMSDLYWLDSPQAEGEQWSGIAQKNYYLIINDFERLKSFFSVGFIDRYLSILENVINYWTKEIAVTTSAGSKKGQYPYYDSFGKLWYPQNQLIRNYTVYLINS